MKRKKKKKLPLPSTTAKNPRRRPRRFAFVPGDRERKGQVSRPSSSPPPSSPSPLDSFFSSRCRVKETFWEIEHIFEKEEKKKKRRKEKRRKCFFFPAFTHPLSPPHALQLKARSGSPSSRGPSRYPGASRSQLTAPSRPPSSLLSSLPHLHDVALDDH